MWSNAVVAMWLLSTTVLSSTVSTPVCFFFTVLGMIELHGVTYKEVTGVVHKDDNVISIH
jgi:hypothetical protein